MSITCCRYCVPPKRHTNCWSTCPEYIAQKEESDRRREEDHTKREIYSSIDARRGKAMDRALKRRRSYTIK